MAAETRGANSVATRWRPSHKCCAPASCMPETGSSATTVRDQLVKAIPATAGEISVNYVIPGCKSQMHPDLVITNKEAKIIIVDVTIPFENWCQAFTNDWACKQEKYVPLANILRNRGYGMIAAGAGAAEPELVSRIVSHLKSQGLFDQFRRDCLADVDTKPAYQNLRQRVDNFVSNHLATHTWSPHLNKNQLRNNIRQQVLKSGMLESGIDRIISQVVDPKINHTFRPQVEKAVHEFLATLNHKEEAGPSTSPSEEKADTSIIVQGVSTAAPSASVASDAMSILETITSLNQEASAARASTDNTNSKNNDRPSKRLPSQQSIDGSTERERNSEDLPDRERAICDPEGEGIETVAKCEDLIELPCQSEEVKNVIKDANNLVHASKEILQESEDQKSKLTEKGDKKQDGTEKGERKKDKKEKADKKSDYTKKNDDNLKSKEEKHVKEVESVKQLVPEKNSNKHKAAESTKEEYAMEDSDMEVLSDITVSSVHTSDLSSFEEESEEEVVVSDTTEEGEITSDDEEEKNNRSKTKTQTNEPSDGKTKPVRHAYIHKPFLYSKYYSDSDDERTVEQRRQSIAREKEERLLRRQINRERLEEKRKQKAAEKTKSLKTGSQDAKGKSGLNSEESSVRGVEIKATGTSIKDVLKEQKFLEKKVALSRKRKRDSRYVENSLKKQSEEDPKETQNTNEVCEKISKEMKHNHGKSEATKPVRRLSESVHSTEESKNDSKVEKEHKRKISTSVHMEGMQQENETRDPKKQLDRTDTSAEEVQKQKCIFKNEKHVKKDDAETQNLKSITKKEVKSNRDKNEKERTLSEDKLSVKHKYKGDSIHKANDDTDLHSLEKSLKGEDSVQKHNQLTKVSSDDKSERKSKHRSERKMSAASKEGKNASEHTFKNDESLRKENNKKDRHISTEKPKLEYKSKRSSSDSRPQKDSQSTSRQPASASQRRSESCSEDKHEVESANSDSNLKQEDNIHRERRRSKSLVEDKFLLKSKSKSHSKQSKILETDLQESFTKQDSSQKPDKDKNIDENDAEKQRKSKNEDKVFEESSIQPELESGAHTIYNSQKESSHKVKLQPSEKIAVKEKARSDKDLSCTKLERKFSMEGHKSKSLKHSNKEMKKEEISKLEDKDIKEFDSSHERILGTTVGMDKKSSKRFLSENKKGNFLMQEVTTREEKQATDVFVTSPIPATQSSGRTNDDSYSEQCEVPMELDSEQTKVHAASKIEEKSNNSQDKGFENVLKENMSVHISKNELRKKSVDFEACASELPDTANRNSEETNERENTCTFAKVDDALDKVSKQASEDQGPIQQGAYQINVVYEKSGTILLNAPGKELTSENVKKPKNLKNMVSPNEENVSLVSTSSRSEDASHTKSVNKYLPSFTGSLDSTCKNESPNLDRPTLNRGTFILDNAATEYTGKGGTVLSFLMKEGEVTMTDKIEKKEESPLISEQSGEDKSGLMGIQEDYAQVTKQDGVQGRNECKITDLKTDESFTDKAADHGGITTKELVVNPEKKERKSLHTGCAAKEEKELATDVVKKNEEHDGGAVIESSSVLVPANVTRDPEDEFKDSITASGTEEGDGLIVDDEGKSESNAVGTSAGNSEHSMACNRLETTEATAIGTSTEKTIEHTIMATSTGEKQGKGGHIVHSEKEGDATTTCSEKESEVTVICTSIEADEGFTTGIWVKSSEDVSFASEADVGECTVATAEEDGGGVTEGFAESESVLTSTKEEESGECSMTDAEESGKGSVNASGVETEDHVNSAGTEEKDDAVTSAGSEEKRKASTCVGTDKFEGSVTCIGEIESDGAVTSAGTEAGEGSRSSENSDGFQSNMAKVDQMKETEGAVTCTGAEERGHNFIICSVTDADAQEESTVTGACVEMVTNNNTKIGTRPNKCEDTVNGESAVTSTGITAEDDADIAVVCTGLGDSSEGFAVCLRAEKCESAMGSTGAKEDPNITMISIGSCDDEGFVTSTGSKEEDEEGEDTVTSTGRGNEEIEHASTCTGMEDESALICIGAEEGESSIICIVAEQVEAESGVAATNVNKVGVDSLTGAEKEANGGLTCKNVKGIVESSVTSAGTVDKDVMTPNTEKGKEAVVLDTEESEGPMTSAVTEKDKEQFATAKGKEENAMICVGNSDFEGPMTTLVAKEDENPVLIYTDKEEKSKDDIHSTSTVEEGDATLQCSVTEVEEGPLSAARTDGNNESSLTLIDTEETEAPMPSTAIDFKGSLHTASCRQEKDECTMISTSIVEEFEAPMPSAARECTAARTEEMNESNVVSIDMELYEVPMPSASSAEDDYTSHPTGGGKEEKDECAMISTSIVEEQVILISSEVTEDRVEHVASGGEAKNETVMIPTSSAECFKSHVSSAVSQDEDRFTASGAEERYETAMITTSMTEECEIVLISTATQPKNPLNVARAEQKHETTIISPNAPEESKIVETSTTDEQFELATLDPGEKSEGSMIFVGNVEECGAPMIAVASNNEDSNTASCVENTEENAVITLSAVEECDSLFTFAVIEESQLDAASTEIKDKNDVTFKSTGQIDYILSSTDSDKSDGSLPLASEGEDESVYSEKKENHDSPVMGESTTKSTVVTEVLGTAENTVKLLSIGKTLCVEITETTACVSPSAEVSTDSERTEDDLPYVDVTSELSCMSSEAAVDNVDYKVNTNLLSESDFSEIRTPPYREQTDISLLSEFGSTLTVNTGHDELSLAAKLGRKNDLPLRVDEQFVSGDKRNAVKVNDDLGFEVSLKKNTTFNSGNKTPVSNLSEELKFKTEVKTEEVFLAQEFKGPTREDPYEEPLAKGCQKDLLQDNAALEKDSKDVENSGMQTAEHSYKEKISKLLETTDKESVQESSNSMVMMEMIKIQTKKKSQVIEMPGQEKGIRMSAMRKNQEGETDDCSVTQDWEKDEQRQCSKTKSKSLEETNSEDTAEVSKVISKKRSSLSSSGEEIDEFTSKQEIYEKADQSSESNINSVEQNQPAIVKRKRGRPRKYPLEAVQPDANLKVDKSIGNSPTSALEENTPQTAKDLSIQKETANEEEAGKIEVMVRRRGRKPKRSPIPAEETETLEPERKRRKSASTTEEETKDQEEDEDEDGDEDDEAHSGATTRSATRLEAQRKQPSKPTTRATFKGNSPSPVSPSKHQKLAAKKKSPSDIKVSKSPLLTQLKMQPTKRKREASPTVVRRKGQQKPDETPLKKTKR
ncbi:biorientation of chromosomes in cell division protein 1-like 1 [Alligator sinensis]|uniref:Biorientation of chromosomes in cell division protein 1-like 1 n=1 Tax=Alligator sinensis TaxID=38654 RepID=A0A3Q0FL26_ALLSI|nr:biorientation of chromosomes in cell division protein 1-like 1 [Alligator sinensis]